MSPVAGPLPVWFSGVGLVLTFLYVCLRLYTDKPGDYVEQLMILLAGVGIFCFKPPLRRSFVVHLLLLAIATQLVSWGLSHWLSPELAERSPKVERLAAWFFLLPIALFAGTSERRILLLWGCAVAVLLCAPWLSGDGWAEVRRGLSGERVGFDLINQQHTSMLFGVVLLGLVIFFHRLQRCLRRRGAVWLALGYGFLMFCATVVVIISQTRAVWLALPITLVSLFVLALYLLTPERRAVYLAVLREMRWRLLGVALVLVVLVPALLSGIIVERVTSEGPLAEANVGHQDEMPMNENIRVRLNTWSEAATWIVKRPLFGWGGNGRGEVVQHSAGLSADEKGRFRHLHSTYFDTLVNFGFAGLLVWFALLWGLTRSVWQARKQGRIGADFFWFWVAFLIYWLVVNAFESYMYYQSGIYVFSLVAGGFLALVMSKQGQQADAQDVPPQNNHRAVSE